MKAFERIFLYTVLAILIFYVFLVDNKVESQVAIQEEIRAKSISIVNDMGQEVVKLFTNDKNNGRVQIYTKSGNPVVSMICSDLEKGAMIVSKKNGKSVAYIIADENDNGE
ncbi:unnamed protein product, partial [marine sediment metagenome]